MIATRCVAVLVLGLFAGLAGCAGVGPDPFVGEWKGTGARVVKFSPDGKVRLLANGSIVGEGTYQRLGGNAARIDMKSTAKGSTESRMQIVRLDDDSRAFQFNRVTYRRDKAARHG